MLFNNQSQVWRHRGRKFFKFNQQKNAKIPWHQKYLLKCGKLSASCLEICLNLKQEINEICAYSWYVYRLPSKFQNSCLTKSSKNSSYNFLCTYKKMMSISLYSHIGQQAGLLLILADFLLMISNSIEYRHHKSGDIKKKAKISVGFKIYGVQTI